jgi:DNA-binding HxlR family transcriptional regulator
MPDYGQFCTVARGAEVFGELWTPLVVRELLCGSRRFNEIRRGVPRMSQTLLTKRLRKLEDLGIVERRSNEGGWEYCLTPAGEELRPLVAGLGHWGARWIGSRLKDNQLDAGFLMWDIRRFARIALFPSNRRVVIHFRFTEAIPRERLWWLVVESGASDLCRDDPGHELDVIVESTVRSLTEIWTGDSVPAIEIAAGRLKVIGAGPLGENLWAWIGTSMFATSRKGPISAGPNQGR